VGESTVTVHVDRKGLAGPDRQIPVKGTEREGGETMAITRYTRRSPVFSPWAELEDMSTRLNRLFSDPGTGEASHRVLWSPPVNVEETKEELLLSAELPGMTIDDIEIEVENNVLSLRGEKTREEEKEDRKYHVWERSFGTFERSFTLPRTVKADEISAQFKDGILNIHMPKAPEAKTRKISIRAES
jgi:HSP20 family protein